MARFVKTKLWTNRILAVSGIFWLLIFGMWIAGGAKSVRAGAAQNGSGFLWTDTFGWISLNCVNSWGLDGARIDRCGEAPGDYGVHIDLLTTPGTVGGRGWSPHLGWVCFGSSCVGPAPDGSAPDITFDLRRTQPVETGNLVLFDGWARAEAHQNAGGESQGGWIQFSGMTAEGTAIQVGMRPTGTGGLTVAGAAWQRNSDRTGLGWIYFGDPPPGNAPRRQQRGTETGVGEEVPAALTRYTTENQVIGGEQGCRDRQDNDEDDGINTLDDDPETEVREFNLGGRDCLDYDCAGVAFWGANYPDLGDGTAELRCGLWPATAGGRAAETDRGGAANCFDGVDNDLDEWVLNAAGGNPRYVLSSAIGAGQDCGDFDCLGAINPQNPNERCDREFAAGEFNLCWDGQDNDNDGVADCDDQDCADFVTCNRRNLIASHPACSVGGRFVGQCAQACPGFVQDSDPSTPDGDEDNDGVCDSADNCGRSGTALRPNSLQEDANANNIGDACDAYLETRAGSLYARRLRGVAGASVATYCVFTEFDGLTPFSMRTQSCALPEDRSAAILGFRLRQYADSFALLTGEAEDRLRARIRADELRSPRRGVVDLTDRAIQDIYAELRNPSSARYYYQGDLHVREPIVIPADQGGITVLVEGNLYFDAGARVAYAGSDTSARALSSLAWVVLDNPQQDGRQGNIVVAPEVGGQDTPDLTGAHLVGTFVASGVLSTGAGDLPLTVGGLMVAREFRFEREFRAPPSEAARAAELIIYDGRAILNPPPGLEDLVKSLPQVRRGAR